MRKYSTLINGFLWNVEFVDREKIQGNDGQTKPNDLLICIANDLNPNAMRLSFIHELTHALLDTQGRCYQKKFDLEELCEFIAWNNWYIAEKVLEFDREFDKELREQ